MLEKNQKLTEDLERITGEMTELIKDSREKIVEIKTENMYSLIITIIIGFTLFVGGVFIDRTYLTKKKNK